MYFVFFLLALLTAEVSAGEVVVTSLDDNGPNTLREALLSVQEGDIIQFDPSFAGQSIILQSSLPDVQTSCTVLGPTEGNIVVNGQALFPVFSVLGGNFIMRRVDIKTQSELLSGIGVFIDTNANAILTDLTFSSLTADPQKYPIIVDQNGALKLRNVSFTAGGEISSKQVLLASDNTLILKGLDPSESEFFVEGNGNVYKTGAGIVHLTTDLSVGTALDPAGLTLVVDQGTLVFTGSTTQPAIISPGATLKGNHSTLYISNAGIVKPGNSIGTIVTSGDFIQTARGTLQIEISPSGASDLIQVGQNAQLSGTLAILPQRGAYYKGDTFRFLTAGGAINGAFDTITSASAGLVSQVAYSPASIQIEILKNLISFDGDKISGNAGAVLEILENIDAAPGSDMRAVIAALNAADPPAPLIAALDQLHPAAYAALGWTEATTLHQIGAELTRARFSLCGRFCKAAFCCAEKSPQPLDKRSSLSQARKLPPTRDCSAQGLCKPQGLWVTGIGEVLYQGRLNRLQGFHTVTEGTLAGYDHAIQERATVGLSGAYTHTDLFWKKGGGRAKINGYYAAAYSTVCLGRLLVDASFLASFYQNNLARKIHFTGVHRTARSSPAGSGLMGHIGVCLPYKLSSVMLSPFATAEYTHLHRNKLKEQKAQSLNLRVASTSMDFVRAEVGLSFRQQWCMSWGALVPSAALSYVYFAPTSNTHLRAHFVGDPAMFTVKTTDHAFHEVSPTASLGFIIGKNIWLSATYVGEFAPKRLEQNLNVSFRWQF